MSPCAARHAESRGRPQSGPGRPKLHGGWEGSRWRAVVGWSRIWTTCGRGRGLGRSAELYSGRLLRRRVCRALLHPPASSRPHNAAMLAGSWGRGCFHVSNIARCSVAGHEAVDSGGVRRAVCPLQRAASRARQSNHSNPSPRPASTLNTPASNPASIPSAAASRPKSHLTPSCKGSNWAPAAPRYVPLGGCATGQQLAPLHATAADCPDLRCGRQTRAVRPW
jgi:hypothetical protein